jgi:biotin transport system substrate-specific component
MNSVSSNVLTGWSYTRHRLFRWRWELTLGGKLTLCATVAALTGLLAQVRVPLGFTPVPVTGQVFAVLLGGVLLGRNYGALSQLLYVAIGSAGVPWFTGGGSGFPIGPTGGFLIGFVPAAALVGWMSDGYVRFRGLAAQTVLMMAAVLVVYLFGAIHFALVMKTGIVGTLQGAVLPFVPIDAAKALCVAAITASLLPKTPFGAERGTSR